MPSGVGWALILFIPFCNQGKTLTLNEKKIESTKFSLFFYFYSILLLGAVHRPKTNRGAVCLSEGETAVGPVAHDQV